MNFRMIGQVIGRVLCIEAALMLLPMVAALAYGETPAPFLITIAVTGGIGLVMWRVRAKSGGMTARDGFLIVGLSWIAMSLFGALLFVLTGDIPNYIDALFETISGLTTTGASVVTAPEEMTRGGMFWRLFTHWIGGMGILVFVLAVLPMSGNRLHNLMTEKTTALEILMAPDVDSEFVLYEDDGCTNEYLKGAYLKTRIAVTAGVKTYVHFTNEGDYDTAVESMYLDMIHREKSPFYVQLDGKELPHFLHRRKFEEAESGWYYSQRLKSVQVKYPNPKKDHEIMVSFEQFDLIGM